MGPQKRGKKVVDLAAKKTTIRDDIYKYFHTYRGSSIRNSYSRIAQARFQMLNNPVG